MDCLVVLNKNPVLVSWCFYWLATCTHCVPIFHNLNRKHIINWFFESQSSLKVFESHIINWPYCTLLNSLFSFNRSARSRNTNTENPGNHTWYCNVITINDPLSKCIHPTVHLNVITLQYIWLDYKMRHFVADTIIDELHTVLYYYVTLRLSIKEVLQS